ncbi:hypothetical protein DZA65_00774 [Dickeya dianthicola]|nr:MULTISPECIES: hypothetical protein [Dickeya]ATO31767.1 hypothetical protein DDI_0599 [Dickeya dianthicola RNS04.9]AYC17680.1 hypothetical protein DZA65_00774 [Dickeya dianthicola]MBT1426878.1 hypothetical protein [Dickeya dianthicola]MBT1430719.1 hypothetical protein [Dickeya dianthicola]MBT1430930.1 hypothetical protein [Dickeya dianthicola]
MITLAIAGQSTTLDERETLSLCDQLLAAASDSPRHYCTSRAGDALTNC